VPQPLSNKVCLAIFMEVLLPDSRGGELAVVALPNRWAVTVPTTLLVRAHEVIE
jgi:hypothetical protein